MMMPSMPRMPGMAAPATMQNPLHVTFKNPNWPPNFITPENVLDYFCNPSNVFYDSTCCNQQIKMQNSARPLEECLQTMPGIQYVVWSSQPPLYVICKQRRNTPANVTPLAYYYVINGVVYQCPDLFTFTQSKLLGAIEPLKKAFDEVVQYSRYNVAKGYYWQFKDKPPSLHKDGTVKEEEQPQQQRSTNFQSRRTHDLMQLLFERFPPSSAIELEDPNSEEEVPEAADAEMAPASESGGASVAGASGQSVPASQSTVPVMAPPATTTLISNQPS